MSVTHAGELPRVLTVEHAGRHGVSESSRRTLVARGLWRRMAAGVVLTRPDPPTRYDWALAGVLLAGPTSAVSGWEALRVAGVVRGDPRACPPILVLTREHRSRTVGPLLIRRTDRPYSTSLTPWDADLPMTPVVATARAVADVAVLAPTLDAAREVVAAGVQRERCGVGELVVELDAGPRQGSAFFRTALADVSAGARSVAEARALTALGRCMVPSFESNVPIVDGAGQHVFTVDVLWRALRAALEIDSAEYHFSRADWLRTLARHGALTAAGLSVLHVPPSEITSDGTWLLQIDRWLETRAAELDVPMVRMRNAQLAGDPPPLVLPRLILPAR